MLNISYLIKYSLYYLTSDKYKLFQIFYSTIKPKNLLIIKFSSKFNLTDKIDTFFTKIEWIRKGRSKMGWRKWGGLGKEGGVRLAERR